MDHDAKVARSLEWLEQAADLDKPWGYFAHPVSSDPIRHSRKAIERAHELQAKYPVTFYVPGLWVAGAELVAQGGTALPRAPEAYWFGLFARIIQMADFVYREPDEFFGSVSPGADAELIFADDNNVMICRGEAELAEFIAAHRGSRGLK